MLETNELFSPIRNERVSQLVEDKIKKAIFENHFTEGDKIPSERELADMFGVSRLSVREALRSLNKVRSISNKKGVTGGAYRSPVCRRAIQMNKLFYPIHHIVRQGCWVLENSLCDGLNKGRKK